MRTVATLCPKCEGQKHVAKPPWVPGDVREWPANDTRSYPCPLCGGRGYVETEPPVPFVSPIDAMKPSRTLYDVLRNWLWLVAIGWSFWIRVLGPKRGPKILLGGMGFCAVAITLYEVST